MLARPISILASLALFVALCSALSRQITFNLWENDYMQVLEINQERNDRSAGISGIRRFPKKEGKDTKDIKDMPTGYYIGIFNSYPDIRSITGYVINMQPVKGQFEIELWTQNIPVMIVGTITNSSLSALHSRMQNARNPFETMCNALAENPDEYGNIIVSRSYLASKLPENASHNPIETDTEYTEATDITYVQGRQVPQGYAFTLSKRDGSAVIGYYNNGTPEYYHKLYPNGQHEFYKQDLCSGESSPMTMAMLRKYTHINNHSYSFYADKIDLCRAIMKSNAITTDKSHSYDNEMVCYGEFHLGVLNGLGLLYDKKDQSYTSGMWLMGYPSDPSIHVKGNKFTVNSAVPMAASDRKRLSEILKSQDNVHMFKSELMRFTKELCTRSHHMSLK